MPAPADRSRHSDEELLARWQQGDLEAAGILLDRYLAKLRRFFATKVPAEADDLAQQTLMVCVEQPEQFRKESTFRSYLMGVARKQLLRHLERVAIHQRRLADFSRTSLDDLGITPSQFVRGREHEVLLNDALARIPLEYQVTMELRYFHDLPVAEIAAALEVPPGTVKSRLSRGRAALREALEDMRVSRDLRDTTLRLLDRSGESGD